MYDVPPERSRSNFAMLLRPKVAIPLFLVILHLLLPSLIRGWNLRGVPRVPEPFAIEPLLELEIPDEENAFAYYRQAAAIYVEPSDHVSDLLDGDTLNITLGINEDGWHLADDEVRQFLRDNEAALQAWKLGTQKVQALQLPMRELHNTKNFDDFSDMRAFTRTVMALGRKLEAQGRHEDAWEWYRSAIRASRHTGTNGSLIERLIGIACFAITANRIEDWAAQPEVSAELLRRAGNELREDWKLTEKTSNVLKVEYILILNTINKDFVPIHGWPVEGNTPWGAHRVLLWLLGEPDKGIHLIRIDLHNRLLTCDQLPFERSPGEWDSYRIPSLAAHLDGERDIISSDEFNRLCRKSIIAVSFMPAIRHFQNSIDRDEIKFRTMLVTLAGQEFFRDHGRFPKVLDELVPDYIDEIPIDTFDGKPLKYRHDSGGPIVYSVFENLTDDGGVEWNFQNCRDPSGPDDLGFQMRIPGTKPLRADKPIIVEGVDSE